MRIAILILLYAAFLIYAGYLAPYRDVEDVCNQASHVVIVLALILATRGTIRALCMFILILNIAELIDELRGVNGALRLSDYYFPILTCIIAAISWKYLKTK